MTAKREIIQIVKTVEIDRFTNTTKSIFERHRKSSEESQFEFFEHNLYSHRWKKTHGKHLNDSISEKPMFLPILKIDQIQSLNAVRGLDIFTIIVRIQDLVTPKGELNKRFNKIKKSGSIHNYLNFRGKIILSSIMRDAILAKFDDKKYCEIINALKPDSWMTPDCEAYEGETIKKPDGSIFYGNVEKSEDQISKSLEMTKKIFPNVQSDPIGVVKGSNEKQVIHHLNQLKSMGISNFVFHVGDFFRIGQNNRDVLIKKAKTYAEIIKKNSKSLMLYGMSSQKMLEQFSFSDYYASMNYFTQATRGKEYVGRNLRKANGNLRQEPITQKKLYEYSFGYNKETKTSWQTLARNNLIQILKNVESIKFQKRINEYMEVSKWAAEAAQDVLAMQKGTMAIETLR